MQRHAYLTLALIPLLTACGGGAESGAPEAPPPEPTAAAMGPRASFEGLSFEVPARWTAEAPSSGMRLAQYRVPADGGDEEEGECALFHFPGTGGTVEANLQRWYGQFTQPDGGSTAERAEIERFQVDGLPVTLVAVSGTYSGGMGGGGPMPGYRMVAGIVETAASPWFLKCTGPEATMGSAEPEVRVLLESVKA